MHVSDRTRSKKGKLETLAGDCVVNAFSFLDINDLNSMKTMNRRMRRLAHYQLGQTKKQRPARLRIVQINNVGYVFNLFLGYGNNDTNYFYAVDNLVSEEIRVRYNGGLNEKYRKLLLYPEGSYVRKHSPIPDVFLENLTPLLDSHAVGGLALRNIRINSTFLGLMEASIGTVNRLEFHGCRIDEQHVERLCSYILQHNMMSLEFHNCELSLSKMMNEQFVETLLKGKCVKTDLIVNNSITITEKCRFYPPKTILNLLIRFDTIDFKSLTLDAQWIPELFEKRLESREIGRMIVGISEIPDNWNFQAFPHLQFFRVRDAPEYQYGVMDVMTLSVVRFRVFSLRNLFVLHADFDTESRGY